MEFINFELFKHISARLLGKHWIFAKTMPENPHWYTLKKQWGNDNEFIETVKVIRQYGYQEKFRHSWYTMFDINEMKYWTMGAPLDQTILINRRIINLPSQYDTIAGIYDNLFRDDVSLRENKEVIAMIPDSDNVLDIGCGTGLFLEHRQPKNYVGIDPSSKMLEVLRNKFPAYQDSIINAKFESFLGSTYDLIISLFGVTSYIDPLAINRVLAMLNPGGQYFLMFYKPGYYPVTYQKAGVNFSHFEDGYEELPGQVTEFRNYLIVTGP